MEVIWQLNAVRRIKSLCHTGPQKMLLSVRPAFSSSVTASAFFLVNVKPHTLVTVWEGENPGVCKERGAGSRSWGLCHLALCPIFRNYLL